MVVLMKLQLKKELQEMFKKCFDTSLPYFINKEKKVIEKIKAENNLVV